MVGFDEIFDRQLPVGIDFEFQRFTKVQGAEVISIDDFGDRLDAAGKWLGLTADIDKDPVVPGDATNLNQVSAMAIGLVHIVLFATVKMGSRDEFAR